MARRAKDVEHELQDQDVIGAVNDILDAYTNIESERGKFMLAARRQREAMGAVYEHMTQKGVSQKVMKIEIKIVRAMEKIRGWHADLEEEEARMLTVLAKAQNDKKQLSFFDNAPDLFTEEDPPINLAKARAKRKTAAKTANGASSLIDTPPAA